MLFTVNFYSVLDYVIAIIIFILAGYVLYTEIARKVNTELFVDIGIAIMIIGISIYNIYKIDNLAKPLTYVYILVTIIGILDCVFFTKRHLRKDHLSKTEKDRN